MWENYFTADELKAELTRIGVEVYDDIIAPNDYLYINGVRTCYYGSAKTKKFEDTPLSLFVYELSKYGDKFSLFELQFPENVEEADDKKLFGIIRCVLWFNCRIESDMCFVG